MWIGARTSQRRQTVLYQQPGFPGLTHVQRQQLYLLNLKFYVFYQTGPVTCKCPCIGLAWRSTLFWTQTQMLSSNEREREREREREGKTFLPHKQAAANSLMHDLMGKV